MGLFSRKRKITVANPATSASTLIKSGKLGNINSIFKEFSISTSDRNANYIAEIIISKVLANLEIEF